MAFPPARFGSAPRPASAKGAIGVLTGEKQPLDVDTHPDAAADDQHNLELEVKALVAKFGAEAVEAEVDKQCGEDEAMGDESAPESEME